MATNAINVKINAINEKLAKNGATSNEENTFNKINSNIESINKNENKEIPLIRNTHVDPKKLMEPKGILDPEAKEDNPLTRKPYDNMYFNSNKEEGGKNLTYKGLANIWSNFPMYSKREEAIQKIYDNQVLLVVSGTGSGKTVLTPKFALHAMNYQGRIAITNPKRLPSEENAIFAAKCLDVKLGKEVGVKYRDSNPKLYSAADTKLLYCTDGYVLARLKADPLLSDFDAVIIDEAHERGIQIDLLLLLLKDLILRRPNFKLIIMSATVNQNIFINYFPKDKFKFAVVDAGEIPNFPIEEHFLDKPINRFDEKGNLINKDFIEAAVNKVIEILKSTDKGDILVFFSGKGEAQDGCTLLHQTLSKINRNANKKLYCDILHSGTDEETKEFLKSNELYKDHPSGPYERKVIIATEVAESSITFKGIDFVVDSGLVNENIFYSEKDLMSLEKKYISKASHKQRKGRTGRTAPGTCYNLFTKQEYEKLFPDFAVSPILLEDIAPFVLNFFSRTDLVTHVNLPFKYPTKTNKQVGGFTNNKSDKLQALELSQYLSKLIEVPREDSVKRALDRLFALGGYNVKDNNKGFISPMGSAMALFDTQPEVARMLIGGYNYKCRDEMCILAAFYELTDYRLDSIFQSFKAPKTKDEAEVKRAKKEYEAVMKKWSSTWGDNFSLLDAYHEFSIRRYDLKNRRTGRVLQEKKGDAREWCRKNHLNYNRLDKIKYASKEFQRKFGNIMALHKKEYPDRRLDFLFVDEAPKLSNKKEENIQSALLDGYYINIIKKDGKRYQTCFPPEKAMAGLSRDSLFALVKQPTKYAFYTQFKSIFGRAAFGIVSKISPSNIDEIKKNKKADLAACWKSTRSTSDNRRDRGRSHDKSRSKSRGKSFSKKHGKGKSHHKKRR
jgi:pre-mRNA-splicing factor ATP-dependent RNA helicase DHX15/PRP43